MGDAEPQEETTVQEEEEGESLDQLIQREAELVARLSALSLELSDTTEELKQVSETIAAHLAGNPEDQPAEEEAASVELE